MICDQPGGQAASDQVWYIWQTGAYPAVLSALPRVLASLPNELLLLAGWNLFTITGGLDAADTWYAPIYNVVEWLEVN